MHKITITMHIWPFRLSYLLVIVLSQPGNDQADAEEEILRFWLRQELNKYSFLSVRREL